MGTKLLKCKECFVTLFSYIVWPSAMKFGTITITSLLSTNPFVIVIALDFSKAFDTVHHSTLLHKIAQLEIPENVYNW